MNLTAFMNALYASSSASTRLCPARDAMHQKHRLAVGPGQKHLTVEFHCTLSSEPLLQASFISPSFTQPIFFNARLMTGAITAGRTMEMRMSPAQSKAVMLYPFFLTRRHTFSTPVVMGNMSTGCTDVTSYPPAVRIFRSLASVAESQLT